MWVEVVYWRLFVCGERERKAGGKLDASFLALIDVKFVFHAVSALLYSIVSALDILNSDITFIEEYAM